MPKKKTPEHILEKKRQYYQANKQKLLEKSKQYYRDNKERIAERIKWRRENDPKFVKKQRAYHRKYYKLKRQKAKNERAQQ